MHDPAPPPPPLDLRRVLLFVLLAFGLAWAVAYVLYRTGGLAESPELVPGTGITLALVLLAGAYMWAPAVAHVLTRLLTREGWGHTGLRLHFRRGWRYWAAAWVLPGLLTLLGGALFFVLFPRHFDPALGTLRQMMEGRPMPPFLQDLRVLVAVQLVQAFALAPVINALFTFGEEFGWRAYLQPKLMPFGPRRAVLVTGVVWGLWHAPLIAMGHNYGRDYPGAPWAGILMMTLFCVVFAVLFGWLTLRGGSVWPAVIGHGALNGIAGLAIFFARGDPNPLVGPLPVGLVGMAPALLLALWLLARARWGTEAPEVAAPDAAPAGEDEAA